MMNRKSIPRAVRDKVLSEFSHKCAVCGVDRPHVHHIDGNHSNNELLNLLPLCPNCHLSDQHDPTHPMDIGILRLFRKHKDPTILASQFYPLYGRYIRLVDMSVFRDANELELAAKELADFVASLEMGKFYSEQVGVMLKKPPLWLNGPDPQMHYRINKHFEDYKIQISGHLDRVEELIIELLRYQSWKRSSPNHRLHQDAAPPRR